MSEYLPEVILNEPDEEWQLVLYESDQQEAIATLNRRNDLSFTQIKTTISRAAFWAYTQERRAVASEALEPDAITQEVIAGLQKNPNQAIVVGLVGRSGSGKTTIARKVVKKLEALELGANLLSTDDYNWGVTMLRTLHAVQEWQNWDAPIVYDTEQLAKDVEKLKQGESIAARRYNFQSGDPEDISEEQRVHPSRVIVIEGILANSHDLKEVIDLHYEVPTPLATCIGRRVLRDIEMDRATAMGGSLEGVLRYQLEVAELEYRKRLTK